MELELGAICARVSRRTGMTELLLVWLHESAEELLWYRSGALSQCAVRVRMGLQEHHKELLKLDENYT